MAVVVVWECPCSVRYKVICDYDSALIRQPESPVECAECHRIAKIEGVVTEVYRETGDTWVRVNPKE
jgi:hypothetical protein